MGDEPAERCTNRRQHDQGHGPGQMYVWCWSVSVYTHTAGHAACRMFQHSPLTTTPKAYVHPDGSPAPKTSLRRKACNHNVHYQHERNVCKRAVPLVRTSFTACNRHLGKAVRGDAVAPRTFRPPSPSPSVVTCPMCASVPPPLPRPRPAGSRRGIRSGTCHPGILRSGVTS